MCIEVFSHIQQINDLCEQGSGLPGTYGRLVENAGFLDDGRLVVIILVYTALVILFDGRHDEPRGKLSASPMKWQVAERASKLWFSTRRVLYTYTHEQTPLT